MPGASLGPLTPRYYGLVIELQLLGGLRIGGTGVSDVAAGVRARPLALLAFVAAAAPQLVSREKIMAALWPESDTERASNSLRQTLFWLRRDLDEDLFLPEPGNRLQLNASRLRIDLWAFREAVGRQAYEEAAAAYGGPFLDGFHISGAPEYSHWIEGERERLEQQYLSAVEAAAQRASEEGRKDDAVRWRRRQAEADRFGSRTALALLRAMAAAGDRPGALEYAASYEKLVRAHLEVEPDPAVVEFVAELRRQPKPVVHAPKAVSTPPPQLETLSAVADSVASKATRRSRPWLVAAAVLSGVAILAAASAYTSKTPAEARSLTPPSTTIVLASGVGQIDGRDPNTRLIACSGPACPMRVLPQNAFVVPQHSAYGTPVAGTRYIAPVADGIAHPVRGGYRCCTTATFERDFALPREAVSATVMVSLLADNQARAAINGVRFGIQRDSLGGENYAGPASTFTTTFAPDPSGTNRLLLTLWDGGGALALHYHAVVTYETGDRIR